MAFFLAMRRVPKARQVVMTAGSPGERLQQIHRAEECYLGYNDKNFYFESKCGFNLLLNILTYFLYA